MYVPKILFYYFQDADIRTVAVETVMSRSGCTKENAVESIAEAIILSREYVWNLSCPPAYRDTDPARIKKGALAAATKTDDPKGHSMFIYGAPGTQKSRSAVCLMAMLYMQGKRVHMLDAVTFAIEAQNCMERGLDGKNFIDRCGDYDLLVIDDAFKRKQTEMQEFSLYAILERRAGQKDKHTVITSNVGLADLPAYFTTTGQANTAEPIIRRIREACRVLRF